MMIGKERLWRMEKMLSSKFEEFCFFPYLWSANFLYPIRDNTQ